MRYLYFLLLVFYPAKFVFAAENLSKFLVIIDRIEVTGNTELTSEQMASNLDIPIGQEIPAASSAELLSEAERKMRATGKFKPDFSFKLRRGESFPHYVLEVKADYTEDWYKGFSASVGYIKDDQPTEYTLAGLYLFTGTRNIYNSDWALDLEMLNAFFDVDSKYETDYFKSKYNYKFQLNGLSLSIARPSFFTNKMIMGGSFRFGHSNALNKSTSSSSYTYQDTHYTFESQSDFHSKGYNLQIEGFTGIKYSGFSFVGVYGRTANRNYWRRSNSDTRSYKNGVEFYPERSDYTDDPSNYYSGSVSLDLEWTLKSKISLVEPGGEYSVNWKRDYETEGPRPPRTLATGVYTFMLPYDIAISPGGRYLWSFDYSTMYGAVFDSRLKRTAELNAKIEVFNHDGEVYYFRTARSGDVRYFSRSSTEELKQMETKISLGYKFASASLVYDLSAIYGQSSVDDGIWLDGLEDVYKRIGAR